MEGEGEHIRNIALFKISDLKLPQIINDLIACIDKFDRVTARHSKRVTEYCRGICEELGLSRNYRETIGVAAMLHDYGKLGIPASILTKPAKLNRVECEIVKTHAEKTRRMLKELKFEGIYSRVPEIAGAHHEKLDGSGYPDGLRVNEIPMGARIIAVADFFEAVTSKRHYRDPIPVKKAFEMLYEERQKRLDKKVVDAFIRYYEMKNTEWPEYRALSN